MLAGYGFWGGQTRPNLASTVRACYVKCMQAHAGFPLDDRFIVLLRPRLFDAVAEACAQHGGPVTVEACRQRMHPTPAPCAKSFARLVRQVWRLGPDEHGRRLARTLDRTGVYRWWLEPPYPIEHPPTAARLARLVGTAWGATLSEVTDRILTMALDALEHGAASPEAHR